VDCGLAYGADPIQPKLNVAGDIEVGPVAPGKSFRIKPILDTAAASPETGDLYFDGTSLKTWSGATWQAVTEQGDIFYRDSDSSLYYFNGTSWQKLMSGGIGPKTIATKIVAASNSLDKDTKADYTCDGVDDQVEIQKAIDDLGSTGTGGKTGGVVYLLEGTYNLSGSIRLDSSSPDDSGKAIIGSGSGTVLGSGSGTVLKLKSGVSSVNVINASSVNRILISQLTIDGNSKTGTSNNGIYFNAVTYSKVDKVWIQNLKSYGIELYSNSNNNTISANNIQGSGLQGIYLYTSCSNNIISANNIQGNSSDGVYITNSCNNNIVSSNNIQGNTNNGFSLNISNNNILSGNNIQGNSNYGVSLNTSNNNVISGNNIQSNILGLDATTANNNTVTGNTIQDSTLGAVYFHGSPNGSFNNNFSSNLICNNNKGGYSRWDAVSFGEPSPINTDSGSNLISNNLFTDNDTQSGNPIDILTGSTKNYIVGNQIGSWPAGANYNYIIDSGTNTCFTDKAKITLQGKQINITASTYTLDVSTNPSSYVQLKPSVNVTTFNLVNGKSAGDLLTIENLTTNSSTITISEITSANINLEGTGTSLTLHLNDILELVWDGSKWLELKFVNNNI